MSRTKFASLHSGMLQRAQIGNGGFFPDAAGATPNVASLAKPAPAPGHVRQPRTDSSNVFTHQNFSPSPARRADILPPGSIAVPVDPEPREQGYMAPAEPAGAQRLIAEAHERVRRWDEDTRQDQPGHGQVATAAPDFVAPTPPRPSDAEAYRAIQGTPTQTREKIKRKAMTLRLEPRQHRALKLASVRLDRTCQDIMATALTSYLAEMDDFGGLDD